MADAFHEDRPELARGDHIAHQSISLVAQDDLAGLGDRLQTCREIGLRTDDRIVHTVAAAEIADIGQAGVDADTWRPGLEVDARSRGQPLVSNNEVVPPEATGGLG